MNSRSPQQAAIDHGPILWQIGKMICRGRTFADNHIEITLVLDEVIIERTTFADTVAAADFAIAKMRAYKMP